MDDSATKSLLGVSLVAASLASSPWPTDMRSLDYRLRELARLARQAVSDACAVINDVRDDALGSALRNIAMAWGQVSRVSVTVGVPEYGQVGEDIRRELVGILREALLNIEKHAHASHARVSLRTADEHVQLTVADDGSGFIAPDDPEEIRPPAYRGLADMRERARRLGGVLTIRSSPGQGTRIDAQIPGPAQRAPQRQDAASSRAVRVLIADGNPVLRLGLRVVLELAAGLEVVGEVADGDDIAGQVRRSTPDVLLLDARLPLAEGLGTVALISQLTRVVMVACADDASLAMRAIGAGAHSFALYEDLEPQELIRVVRNVAAQWPGFSDPGSPEPGPSRAAADPPRAAAGSARPARDSLRPREREIMQLIAEGLSNRQIAARLVISEKTVKNHICSIYGRLSVHERGQAVRRWRER
jgi:DNA-binding NarL/FixJ family response regulator/two-component sensor histidine kinase